MVTRHTLSIWLLVTLTMISLGGCSSLSGPKQETREWKAEWKHRAKQVGEGTTDGAKAVGRSMKTAFQGVRTGFEDPDASAYGPYPKTFATAIRKHMLRFQDVPSEASFTFKKPEKGYMNKGILAGGGISWQGYLIDVEIEVPSVFESQARPKSFVVRMRSSEVIEVHEAEYASALHRLEQSPPAKRSSSH